MFELPILRGDILSWLFLAGFAIFGSWWKPLTGQSQWTVLSAAVSAASFLIVALTFTLLFNKNNLFRKGWAKAVRNKGIHPLQPGESIKIAFVFGSGESETRCVYVSDLALFLTLENNKTRGLEFPFKETSVEMGMLYRYFQIRPALRLKTKALGDVSVYIFKADPSLLFALFAVITENHSPAPPAISLRKRLLVPVMVAGMLLTSTFGLWRITTITHAEVAEPTYPVGVINTNQVGMYELPTNKSKLIANLKFGEEVLVIKSSDNWDYVMNPSEQMGYVARERVTLK
jgi:hypothetical protein